MRITTTTATLLLVSALSLSSCRNNQDGEDATPASPGRAVYHNPGANLRLTYPTSWTKLDYGQQGTKALVAFVSPPDENGERQHLAFDVRKLSENVSLEQMKDAAIAEAKGVFPKFELVSSSQTTFGGHPAYQTVYTASTEKGSARILQVMALNDGKACSATYTARSEAGFDRSLPQIEEIVRSVKIE
jgi:hypothetical protein